MSEMFEAIDARHAAAEENLQEEEARRAAALEKWRQEEALRQKKARQRADIGLGLRGLLFSGIVWGLCAASDAGLMAGVLAGGLLLLAFTAFGFYAGAWWQFRFGNHRTRNGDPPGSAAP